MRGHRLLVSLFTLVAGAGTLLAQSTDPSSIVRLSLVQGQVSILEGDTTQFSQAQANMPLLAGYTLATGENGQAEVEFTDGSVARLTPQSQLRLVRLPNGNARDGVTELELVAGLGYFELNTADGQRYAVHFSAATAQPAENSIFRIDLDSTPDLAVFAGSVRATADGAFDETVSEGRALHFQLDDASHMTTAETIQSDSWDRWNQDRDNQIASEAQQQTSARETAGASNQPGWDDLDANGDWYPTEDYGNVWVPSNVPTGWDPYGSGYWANYPGWGYTWISAYSWGWLPYHCGAWNYWNSFGWGWVPGQCGLGWQPGVTVWNAPGGFRPPPRPIPGGHSGPAVPQRQLLAVNRGPALQNGGAINHHTQPVRLDGQRLDPLPVRQDPTLGGRFSYRGTPTPVGRSYGYQGNDGSRVMAPGAGLRPGQPGMPPSVAPSSPIATPRPIYRVPSPIQNGPRTTAPVQPSPGMRPTPQPTMPRMTTSSPRMSAPAPRMSAPAPRMAAPAPRVAAPAPRVAAPTMSAPRLSAPSPGHH